MVIRQSARLIRLYRRAYRRRALAASAPISGTFSAFPRANLRGYFSDDFTHYQSPFISSFSSSSLTAFDSFVRYKVIGHSNPLEVIFGNEPNTESLQVISQPKTWENVQSVSYQLWEKETLLRSVKPAAKIEIDQSAPQEDSEKARRAKREDQLRHVSTVLADSLPKFFTSTHNYAIYSQDVEFENRIRNITTKGLRAYFIQMVKYRNLGHLAYSYVKMEVLKITEHPEDMTVRVRWRVSSIGGAKPILQFWKLFAREKKLMESIDGFSTFVVGDDGLVHKHIADKMMPDDEKIVSRDLTGKFAKLAAFVGFAVPLVILD